jgi:SAM-dependent methyltransferase
MPEQTSLDTRAGAAVYSPLTLKVYDLLVLGASNRWVWECPTDSVLLPFYQKHVGARHLDVGVGTGFYLQRAGFSSRQHVALLDLNESSLRVASHRLAKDGTELFVQDVMQPLTALKGKSYDSIALFYLLHCLPGDMADKARVFDHLKQHLSEGGVLYGATILGDSVGHNVLGRTLIGIYNKKGIFGNRNDTYEGLARALGEHFEDVQLSRHGKVACFEARLPRQSPEQGAFTAPG